jgi:hypothetical protein
MTKLFQLPWLGHAAVGATMTALMTGAYAYVPQVIAAADVTAVAKFHAEGAQIYECKLDMRGNSTWQFREPVATLMMDGKTVGRHYAGPRWELIDGSAIGGEVVGRLPGATTSDIPLLKLKVTEQNNVGRLSEVTVVQRLNTSGGALEGPCTEPGMFRSVPYAADYTFLRPTH